jgi:hypothetical protein
MRIGEISFCDKIGYNIRSDETKKHILEKLQQKYNIRIIARHYEKFEEEKSMNILTRNPHLMCARSNGNPYILYLTKYNFVDICIFIDKKVQQGYFLPRMIISHLMIGIDPCVHDDTVLHGEMIKKNDGSWVFAINDMTVFKGKLLSEENLVKRLNMLYTLLKNEYMEDDMTPFKIVVKKYFTYEQASELEQHLNTLPYTCRGIYFKPLFIKFKDILLNFDDSLVKKTDRIKVGGTFMLKDTPEQEKRSSDECTKLQTISDQKSSTTVEATAFQTKKTSAPDVYDLFDDNGINVGIACIPTMVLSKKMRTLFETKSVVDKITLRYVFNEKFKKWVPQV